MYIWAFICRRWLLSISAAYGILVIIFQWGWLDGFLGFQSLGALDTLTPPLVLAVVFVPLLLTWAPT